MREVLTGYIDHMYRWKRVLEDDRNNRLVDGHGISNLPPYEGVAAPRVGCHAAHKLSALVDSVLELCAEVLIGIQLAAITPRFDASGNKIMLQGERQARHRLSARRR